MKFETFTDQFESIIGTNFWTMIFAWINILILYLFLRKLLFNPVKNMIDSRQKEIDDMFADAETKEKAAEEDKAAYAEKLRLATEESENIRRQAQRDARLKEEEILKEAEDAARRTRERAMEEIEREKKRALNEVKDEVSGMAVEIASCLIGRDVKPEEHAGMIDEFLDKLE